MQAVRWGSAKRASCPYALLFRCPVNAHVTLQFVLQRTLQGAIQQWQWQWIEGNGRPLFPLVLFPLLLCLFVLFGSVIPPFHAPFRHQGRGVGGKEAVGGGGVEVQQQQLLLLAGLRAGPTSFPPENSCSTKKIQLQTVLTSVPPFGPIFDF